jgi:hypothetical protein
MRHPGRTSPFRTAAGGVVQESVAEVGYCRLGGVDQWVMIRGENVANPPLIHLHGGPGFSETRLFRHFNSDLEKQFTVVYWDQRGAGKSFNRTIPRSSMTLEQFIVDLGELIDTVCARVGHAPPNDGTAAPTPRPRNGICGLVDGRRTRRSTPMGRIDQRVVALLETAIAGQVLAQYR